MSDGSYIRELAQRIRAKVDQSALPDQGLDDLFDSYAVLALAKGSDVTNEDVHNAWSAWATKYDSQNDSLIPFDQLPADKQAEDSRFVQAIHEVSKHIENRGL